MTLMSSISKLTTSVDQLAGKANVTKAQLDAKVAQADAAVVATQAEHAATEAARDEAATHAASAATHLATVKADVTYQGIGAILSEKAVTAVDVFVYDTSLDSDGGAWRKRCTHASWYNEPLNTATRGARREFPAVAVLVIDAGGLSIYDADAPALPMWMFFQASFGVVRLLARGDNGMLRAVSAMNGRIVVASGGSTASVGYDGISIFDFVADTASRFSGSGSNYVNPVSGLAKRNISGYPNGTNAARVIVDRNVNDVAMTVLPKAPVDPATGLSVPTIAVAAAGGVSVIKDDGTVANITHGSGAVHVQLDGARGLVAATFNVNFSPPDHLNVYAIPVSEHDRTENILFSYRGAPFTPPQISKIAIANGGFPAGFVLSDDYIFGGQNSSPGSNLSIISRHGDQAHQLGCIIDSKFNSGWLPGDILGAFLADTDEADLTGAEYLNSTEWTLPTGWNFSDGVLSYDGTGAVNSRAYVPITLPAGVTITVTFEIASKTGSGSIGVGFGNSDAGGTLSAGPTNITTGVKTWTLTSNGATASLYFQVIGAPVQTFSITGISVRLSDADRSVNNNGLTVNGATTRSPVADGAELVGYSGFSATNYLEQPYNPASDFGTGDFSIMGWVKFTGTPNMGFLHRETVFNGGSGFGLYPTSGQIAAQVGGTATLTDGKRYDDGTWKHLALLRRSGQAYLFVNGAQVWAAARAGSVADPTATLRLGSRHDGIALTTGSLALWRISATAPTPDQIAKIYEDERKLFMHGAKCTLHGTSDAVTALAHDPKTNLLRVGTSQGHSVFDGLQRVANIETPVTTAISAVGGMIAEQ
jgi:hypothetical protein